MDFPILCTLELWQWQDVLAVQPSDDSAPHIKAHAYWGTPLVAGHLHDAAAARKTTEQLDAMVEGLSIKSMGINIADSCILWTGWTGSLERKMKCYQPSACLLYTTNVTGEVFYVDPNDPHLAGNKPKIFIRPNPYNEHVTFNDFMSYVRDLPGQLKGANILFVEDVGYQKAAIQEMERMMLPRCCHDAATRQAQQASGCRTVHQERNRVISPAADANSF